MSMIRWNPVFGGPRDLSSIQDEVNRLFDGFGIRPLRGDAAQPFTPAVDVEENKDAFVLRADLPGISTQDVKVNLIGDTLTLRGERRQQQPDSERKDQSFHRIERSYGAFERSFTFGTPVQQSGIEARYRDGVLEIRVPKAEEAKLREIEVQVGS